MPPDPRAMWRFQERKQRLHFWLCLVILLSAFTTGLPAIAAESAGISATSLEVGWKGFVRLGRWNLATVHLPHQRPGEAKFSGKYWLECTATDSEGHAATFRGQFVELSNDDLSEKSVSSPSGEIRLTAPFQVGRLDSVLQLRVLHQQLQKQEETEIWSTVIRAKSTLRAESTEPSWQPLVLSDRLVVTVGQPRGLEGVSRVTGRPGHSGTQVIGLDTVSSLPAELAAYSPVDWLILAGQDVPSTAVSSVLTRWVQAGGRLLVSLPASVSPTDPDKVAERVADKDQRPNWLPVGVTEEPAIVRELGSLEAFAGRNVRIPYAGRMEMPKLDPRGGVVLAASRDDAVLVRAPWGLGEAWILALDLTRPPLANWSALPDLMRRCLETDQKSAGKTESASNRGVGQLTSSGISDLASQLQASLDHFPLVRRPAPWWSMAWLLGLLVIVGPLDYALVHYVFRRPQLTWLTLPLWIAAVGGYAIASSEAWNQPGIATQQMEVLDVDSASASLRIKNWTTTYSPDSDRYQVSLQPATNRWGSTLSGIHPDSRLTGWFFPPESTSGGLYRTTSGEWGRAGYEIVPSAGTIEQLPILKWSTRTLATTWSGSATQLVESHLRNTGLGRLTGDLTHHLPGTLTNWFLAYGSRVYRLQPSRDDDTSVPWETGVRLSTEDPLMLQADLRSLLTRMVITEETEVSRISERRLNREQGRYEVYERQPLYLWQMLSFHRQAGGQAYTGLTNDWLNGDDLTAHLEMGRAVLFGELEAEPMLECRINGQPQTPQKQTTIVRIVLPVSRSGEVIRTLPKLGEVIDSTP